MKTINFTKFNATGNDFIIIDNRKLTYKVYDKARWASLCCLKTGIGADGVLLLEGSSSADFKMRYINADGGEVEIVDATVVIGQGALIAVRRIGIKRARLQCLAKRTPEQAGIALEYQAAVQAEGGQDTGYRCVAVDQRPVELVIGCMQAQLRCDVAP